VEKSHGFKQFANKKLTPEQALYIYRQKNASRDMAARLAEEYDVRPKTVRDIWTQRTWASVTASTFLAVRENVHACTGMLCGTL